MVEQVPLPFRRGTYPFHSIFWELEHLTYQYNLTKTTAKSKNYFYPANSGQQTMEQKNKSDDLIKDFVAFYHPSTLLTSLSLYIYT